MGIQRQLPNREFLYTGTAPDSETLISSGDPSKVFVGEIILTNITSDQVTVTLKNNESSPVTKGVFVIEGNDQWSRSYEFGWDFTSGIRISADTADAVNVHIFGVMQRGN